EQHHSHFLRGPAGPGARRARTRAGRHPRHRGRRHEPRGHHGQSSARAGDHRRADRGPPAPHGRGEPRSGAAPPHLARRLAGVGAPPPRRQRRHRQAHRRLHLRPPPVADRGRRHPALRPGGGGDGDGEDHGRAADRLQHPARPPHRDQDGREPALDPARLALPVAGRPGAAVPGGGHHAQGGRARHPPRRQPGDPQGRRVRGPAAGAPADVGRDAVHPPVRHHQPARAGGARQVQAGHGRRVLHPRHQRPHRHRLSGHPRLHPSGRGAADLPVRARQSRDTGLHLL
ncbi:MAG: hypothetical protein AVDCRST_MAG68-520, partial [uncultured Gemmatimonadetes bacterium]